MRRFPFVAIAALTIGGLVHASLALLPAAAANAP